MIPAKIKGFTLLELMVVVAIIGILAAISIPSYLTLVARAKKSEARMNLSSIYTAETGYYAENLRYSANFAELGWSPTGRNLFEYKIGLGTTSCNSGAVVAGCDSINPTMARAVAACTFSRSTAPYDAAEAAKIFTATAEGNIDPGDPSDGWSISEKKDLIEDCDEIM